MTRFGGSEECSGQEVGENNFRVGIQEEFQTDKEEMGMNSVAGSQD
jgi:hypothetical protein